MKFIEKLKQLKIRKKAKSIVGIVAAAAVLSIAIFPLISMKADEVARFNFLQNDKELLQGLNKTQGEENWKDPVDAVAGDKIALRVYFHNGKFDETGQVDTTAINTVIKTTVPSQTTNGVAHLSASIDADNAAQVTETVVDDVVVGTGTGLTVNFDRDATLEYIPGSTQIWRENPLQNGVVLPDGITEGGVNIGDVKGCWQFAGYVTFQIQSHPKVIPSDLDLTKEVRNVSAGQANFVKSTVAEQSDRVEYRINVENDGLGASANVHLKDALPSGLAAVPGSGRIVRNGSTSAISLADFLTNGIDLGEFAPNESANIYFEAVTPNAITVADTLINTVYLTSANFNLDDSAAVVLEPGFINIGRSKSAFNETQGVNAEAVPANAGDIIRYTLNTRNTGNLVATGNVADDIIDVLDYADVIEISDHGILANGFIEYPEFSIEPGMELSDWFRVKVKSPIPINPQNGFAFDKVMYNKYGNEVIIPVNVPVLAPILSIDKLVRNVTSNEPDYVNANTAYAGDTLEYKIMFKNTGNGPADSVKLYDVLPANVSLDTSVPAIINLNGQERSITENLIDGFRLVSLAPGQEGYVRFRAIISSGIAANENLVNKGFLEYRGNIISDNAETVILAKAIKVSAPVITLPRSGGSNQVVALVAALLVTFGLALTIKKVRA